MKLPPDYRNRGVFSIEVRADVLVYGLLIGAFSIGAYSFVEYAIYAGASGLHCNDVLSTACLSVYRARATTFVTMGLLLLANSFDCRDSRKYLWQMNIMSNKALVFAFGLGAASLVALVYIPYVNTELMKQAPISWEWAVPVVCVLCFELLVQAYKAVKNRFWPLITSRELDLTHL
jgi:magnesium-transporting ATPase (P-type)